jgi:hypothetical protein
MLTEVLFDFIPFRSESFRSLMFKTIEWLEIKRGKNQIWKFTSLTKSGGLWTRNLALSV